MKFISTEGHGYLRVTIKQVNKAIELGYKPSTYSFYNSKVALLEEDQDMSEYLKVMFPDTYNTVFKTIPYTHQKDINRNCYERFDIVNCKDKVCDDCEYSVVYTNEQCELTELEITANQPACKEFILLFKDTK